MYLIGPLLFWACGEMACGFFIFSVPCLSKLIMESGLPRHVKVSLGFAPRPSNPSYEEEEQSKSGSSGRLFKMHPMQAWGGTDTMWSRIEGGDENSGDITRSESQTNLYGGDKAVQVSRTVEVSVSQGSP